MKWRALRIWLLATIAPVIIAAVMRLGWEMVVNPSVSGTIMSVLVSLGLVSFYALVCYFTLKPKLEKFTSLPVGLALIAMAAGALAGGIIHFVRFIHSPLAGMPWSLIIAVLYLLAATSAYGILIWWVWYTWRKKRTRG